MKIFQADNCWRSLCQGSKNRLDRLLQLRFPEFRTHIIYLGITEGIKTSYIRNNFFFFTDNQFYPGFDFFPHFFLAITFFYLKSPIQQIDQRKVGDILSIRISVTL